MQEVAGILESLETSLELWQQRVEDVSQAAEQVRQQVEATAAS